MLCYQQCCAANCEQCCAANCEQCCEQGYSAMKTMLLQPDHILLQVVNKDEQQ